MFIATNESIICCVHSHTTCDLFVTAVKFDRQAGYRLPNHSSITCYMLADFHSNGAACSTGKAIGSWQRFFLTGKGNSSGKDSHEKTGK